MPAIPLKPREGFFAASLLFGDPPQVIDGSVNVKNSQTALVELSNPDQIPNEFELIATSIQIRRRCTIIERFQNGFTVKFVQG